MNAAGHLDSLILRNPSLGPMKAAIWDVFGRMAACFQSGGKLLLCGNGGSACDCEHIAGELMKGFLLRRPLAPDERAALGSFGAEGAYLAGKLQRALPSLVLTGLPGLTTAFSNDVDPALAFAQQAFAYARPGDVIGAPARLENDANACALAEWRWGAGRGANNMVFLTFGTGFGAGLILDGRLYRGASGDAGEVGHWRLSPFGPSGYGKIGSFEGFCSGGGIRQLALTVGERYRQAGKPCTLLNSEEISARTVALAARAGDEAALEVFSLSAEMLGRGLALIVDLLNPDAVVIGSIYARSEDLIEKTMRRALLSEALVGPAKACRILPAALGDSIGDYASLVIAVQAHKEQG